MRADIYIMTTFRGVKQKEGKVMYLIRVKRNGEDKTLCRCHSLTDATPLMAERRTLIVALRNLRVPGSARMHPGYEPHIYISRADLASAVGKWVEGWERVGWKTVDGKPVRHCEEWKELVELLRDVEPVFHVNEAHEFYNWMKGEIGKCQAESKRV